MILVIVYIDIRETLYLIVVDGNRENLGFCFIFLFPEEVFLSYYRNLSIER